MQNIRDFYSKHPKVVIIVVVILVIALVIGLSIGLTVKKFNIMPKINDSITEYVDDKICESMRYHCKNNRLSWQPTYQSCMKDENIKATSNGSPTCAI